MTGLDEERIAELIEAAVAAREHAYAPYSDFRAGAAVRDENGDVHVGALVENLIFGLAMCAERVALFTAVSHGARRPQALVLAAPATAGSRTWPCGSCLQVAAELGSMDLVVVASGPSGEDPERRTIRDLAPGLPLRARPPS